MQGNYVLFLFRFIKTLNKRLFNSGVILKIKLIQEKLIEIHRVFFIAHFKLLGWPIVYFFNGIDTNKP